MSLGSTMLATVSEVPPASRLSTLPEGEPEFTLGWEAIRWAETMLVQPNGLRAGQSFRMTVDQMRFTLWWYAMDSDGRWLYRHGARRLAKGSGKSPYAAVLALIEFCAPVRLARKDSRLPGGCKGRPVDMPLVQIAAVSENQTHNIMRMVRAFAPKGSRVVEAHGLDPGKTRYYKQPEGTLEIITSSVMSAEGAEPSLVLADETENWRPVNSGPDLAATLADNLAKSGSRMLESSNAWMPGVESVAEATWDAWVAQEEHRLRGETKILYDARIAPPEIDLTARIPDLDTLRGALRWVYGDCDWKRGEDGEIDVRSQVERILSLTSKATESQRKYLNIPTSHEDAWTTQQLWAALADRERKVTSREEVVLFFDGSRSRDATALIGCCVTDGHVFTVGIWEPNPSHDTDDVINVAEVDAAVQYAFDNFNVVGFYADVNEWESFTKIDWPARFGDRLRVWAVKSGNDPQRIAWDMRGHVYEFTRAAELTDAEILEGGFTHDDNPILARHVANCRRDPNTRFGGVSVAKASPDSPLKIDAAVCMIGARLVRRAVLSLPTAPKPTMPRRIR